MHAPHRAHSIKFMKIYIIVIDGGVAVHYIRYASCSQEMAAEHLPIPGR
jgi:hypothetical protein